MKNHCFMISERIVQDNEAFQIEIDFLIKYNDEGAYADIQDIRFYPLEKQLKCPKCSKMCDQKHFIHEVDVYPHDQYYYCSECIMIFTKRDLE